MIRFVLGTLSVDLQSYQWGYRSGTSYLERVLGTSGGGVLYRQKVGTTQRLLTVEFQQSDASLSQLRELGILAGRTGRRVQFIPDTTDLGTYRWVDWPAEMDVQHSVEGRLVIEVPLVEQAA